MSDTPAIDRVRPLGGDEQRAALEVFRRALLQAPIRDRFWDRVAAELEPGRTLGVVEGGTVVATARSFGTRTAVPGGAVLDLAAVTQVAVRADRTRRGLLTALMRAQLDDLAARGEPLAALHASQAPIYGRFGYGIGTRARQLSVRAGRAFRPAVPVGEVRLVEGNEIAPTIAAVHERLALRRPGGIERPAVWRAVATVWREQHSVATLAAVHTGAGGPDGFAFAQVGDGGALTVYDLHAGGTAATAGLWRFLLGVDLVQTVTAVRRPLDEPLELLMADPRDVAVTGLEDELWLRLVDVPAALAARSWGAPSGGPAASLLLGVHDPFLPANAGVYRIGGGVAERVEPLGGPVAPQLECDAGGLAMAYLGDRRPSELVATGWWTATDPAAVPVADAAFAADATPWCGTMF